MKTIEEIRRARLLMLKEEFGSYAALNDRTGRDRRDSTLSQYANESANSRGGTPKAMGSDVARGLEGVCDKPRGWMDNDPDLWPFDGIDLAAIHALDQRSRDKLSGALIATALQIGIDVQKRSVA